LRTSLFVLRLALRVGLLLFIFAIKILPTKQRIGNGKSNLTYLIPYFWSKCKFF